ncbi:MAG: glycosyltransferase family 2 protein [Candidatus Dormibacteraceae bacterium]
MKVSVCVPAYERPATLEKLIRSVQAQKGVEWEVCISDDSPTDAVQTMVGALDPSGTRYRRNPVNLGYHANLKAALKMATGDVLVVLGDDDLLVSDRPLERYARAFEEHPQAGFAYANLLQIDDQDETTLRYDLFSQSTEWTPGAQAIRHLLLCSIMITGMAFRASADPISFYPSETMLFPQVALTRDLLLRHSGVGITEHLSAMRAWDEQLGFNENSKRAARIGPRHGNIEIMEVIASIADACADAVLVIRELERQYARAYTTNLVNERIHNGRWVVCKNVVELARRNRAARRSPLLLAVWLAAMVLPAGTAMRLKLLARHAAMQFVSRRPEPQIERLGP